MTEVNKNLYVGRVLEVAPLVLDTSNWAVVNTANTFHNTLHNWNRANPNHPCYVIHQEPALFSINWVDAKQQYFDYQGKGIANTNKLLHFIDVCLKDNKNVFICCDQGLSRSPSMALLYLSLTGIIARGSYLEARNDFLMRYPQYLPGEGIEQFIAKNWSEFSI